MFFRDSWYRDAHQSPLTPPSWVFAVVWPLNYITSSLGATIFASKTSGTLRRRGVGLWVIQAIVTSVWTRIFGRPQTPRSRVRQSAGLLASGYRDRADL
jgi:tryptophan-rich sensory protein